MADFDAGSIEGRLELDTDPFIRGLREAKAQAAAFEHGASTSTTAGVDVDTGDAEAKIAATEAALKRIDHERATAEVRVDNNSAIRTLAALERQIDAATGFYKQNSSAGLGGGSGHGMAYLIGLAASLAPALGPATAAVGLFGAATIAAFGGAAVSMALWGKVASGVFKQIAEANKAGTQLTGSMGQLQTALKGLTGAWDTLEKKAAPGIAKALIPTFRTLEHLIPKLLPLINSISTGLGGALRPIDDLLKSKRFDHFIDLLGSNAVKDLPQVGAALAHILGGLMGVFTALNPVIQAGLPVIVKITKEFDKWSKTKAGGAVQDIFATIQQYGPPTLKMLHSLFGALGNLAKGLAPLTGPALTFLTGLFDAIDKIDLGPLATAVGDVLDKLTPFLDVIATLVNVLLPPFSTLIETLADSFIGPLGESLSEELAPGLDALAGLLDRLAEPLGLFVASIADLVNPTGVGLLSDLMKNLAGPVGDILVPLINLATTLEGVVDDFLKAVSPAAIPVLTGLMKGLADIVGPLADGLSAFLDYGPVGPILLGIAGGIKATILAVKGYEALAAFVGILKTITTLAAAEGIMAGIAAVSPALAAGLTAIGVAIDFMLGPIGLIILAVAAVAAAVYLIYKNWGPISDWFGKMWEKIQHFFSNAVDWLKDAGKAILHGLLNGLKWVWHHSIYGFLFDRRKAIIGFFAGAGSWLLDKGKDILRGLKDGVVWVWQHSLTAWLLGLGGKVLGAIGDLSKTLYSAGIAILQGFWDGLKDKWGEVKHWVGGLGGQITQLKGPIEYDRTLLIPHGKAFMVGLGEGLGVGFEDVKHRVGGMAGSIRKALEDGIGSVVGTATVDVRHTRPADPAALYAASQSEALARLDHTLSRLADAIPSATKEEREEMVDALGKAFSVASDKQARTIITAVRKS